MSKKQVLKTFGAVIMGTGLIIYWGSENHQVPKSHKNHDKVKGVVDRLTTTRPSSGDWQVAEKDWQEIRNLVDYQEQVKAVAKTIPGLALGEGGKVLVDGVPVQGRLANVLAKCLSGERSDSEKFVKFHRALQKASESAKTNLYNFIEGQGIAIDDDGNVLALKIVDSDYKDLYTHTLDNSPGRIVKMDRKKVVEDPSLDCAAGLHVCSPGYLRSYGSSGSPTMLIMIEPQHFVSVPSNYSYTKARVEQYKVLQRLGTRDEVQRMGATIQAIIANVDKSKNSKTLPEISQEGVGLITPKPEKKKRVRKPAVKKADKTEVTSRKKARSSLDVLADVNSGRLSKTDAAVQLVKVHGETVSESAKVLKVSRSTVSRWLQQITYQAPAKVAASPTDVILAKLAVVENGPMHEHKKVEARKVAAKALLKIDHSVADIAKAINVSASTVRRYINS